MAVPFKEFTVRLEKWGGGPNPEDDRLKLFVNGHEVCHAGREGICRTMSTLINAAADDLREGVL